MVLVHSDLSTAEQIESLQQSRGKEKTPWRLFHLKMACADVIWKLCIQPKAVREDETSLMHEIAVIRPKETAKIGSNKPGFHRMHEVIQHRVKVKQIYGYPSLEKWAKMKPMTKYSVGHTFTRLRLQPQTAHDQQQENTLLRQRYYLLYEEITYAMNAGDIGRVKQCFLPWILIFKGCGKHKYTTHMLRFLHNLHYVYPPKLKRAICMNILCNLMGKPDGFQEVDWWLEHNNFYTKQVYGGQFSNCTKCRILKESVLIQVYKRIWINFENMFMLHKYGYKHLKANMVLTFKKLVKHIEKKRTHEFVRGRTAAYVIPDAMDIGLQKLISAESVAINVDEENIAEKVDGDDGNLDV
ncbi:hypothetical protein OBBRIDRAFT_814892 [Obba rivulosa]|uniref:DUF6589 domain-containing protein n=1 Tax=Obba rivulosa TaxID=1052685 RepID=A0A8E2DKI9_9APHY|nr:hypothetical protein OBBRIDRAFT_814892 [Obba rivulosa]